MSEYPNSGILGVNLRKRPGTQDPPYSGQCEVDGKAYWVAAWVKNGKNGKFFSMSFKPKESKPTTPLEDQDDEVPF